MQEHKMKLASGRKLIFDRKGEAGDQMMFVFVVFMFIVIGGGIVLGVLIYFGSGYDSRAIDSAALNYKMEECIFAQDNINQTNFYEKCNFDENALLDGNYFIGIQKDGIEIFRLKDYKSCLLTGEKSVGYPACQVTQIEKNGETFKVIAGSNQLGRSLL